MDRKKFKFSLPLVLTLLISLAASAYSLFKDNLILEQQAKAKKFSVAAIQGNIGNIEKLSAEQGVSSAMDHTIELYESLSLKANGDIPNLDLIVWPETAFPDSLFKENRREEIESFTRELKQNFVFGGYDTEIFLRDGKYEEEDYNTIFAFNKKGEFIDAYHKVILLAFGEYFPFSDRWPSLKRIVPAISHFGRGPGPKIIPINGVKLLPLICYEAIFPDFVREGTALGPNILFNVTNDSWFGRGYEPEQHLVLSKFRTIEHRLPMIRSTNTGITAMLDARGQIIAQGKSFAQDIIHAQIPVMSPPDTIYFHFGNWPIVILSLLILGIALIPRKQWTT